MYRKALEEIRKLKLCINSSFQSALKLHFKGIKTNDIKTELAHSLYFSFLNFGGFIAALKMIHYYR